MTTIKTFLLCSKIGGIYWPRIVKHIFLVKFDELFDVRFDLLKKFDSNEEIIRTACFYGNLEVAKLFITEPTDNILCNAFEKYDIFPKYRESYKTMVDYLLSLTEKRDELIKFGYKVAAQLNSPEMMKFFAEKMEFGVQFINDVVLLARKNLESFNTHLDLFYTNRNLSLSKVVSAVCNADIKVFKSFIKKFGYHADTTRYVVGYGNIDCINYMLKKKLYDPYDAMVGACECRDEILSLLILGLNMDGLKFYSRLVARIGRLEKFKIAMKLQKERNYDFYYIVSSINNPEIKDYIASVHTVDLTRGRKKALKLGKNMHIDQANLLMKL